MAIRDELKHFKKERILEEAERLFYERGFRGTSLDAIAESLDMTKPFIYGAYERKLDILVDIYERAMNRALDAIRGAREAGGTPAEQLRRFEHQCAVAGIHRVHGFRHQYAQVRYRELTGWAAPAAGGPRSRELTAEQKAIDREARLTISAELGHEREQVTAVYLGR